MNRFIAFDIESGGTTSDLSLLTAYFLVLDDQLNSIESLDLKAKPNDGKYLLTAGGMAVNKIDIVKHDSEAVSYSEAGKRLWSFLQRHSNSGKIKLIPIGKNVEFDINGITAHLIGRTTWNNFVSYRTVEVTSLAMVAQITGKLPAGLSLSLGSLAEHFKVVVEGSAHEAKYDTLITVEVLKKLMAL